MKDRERTRINEVIIKDIKAFLAEGMCFAK